MRFKGRYAILLLTLVAVLLWVVTGCGKDTDNEALLDPSGRESGLPPCSPTDTAGDACEPRDVSNLALFSSNAQGAAFTDCWQSAQVGQIRTREDYYYEELRGSSLRVLL